MQDCVAFTLLRMAIYMAMTGPSHVICGIAGAVCLSRASDVDLSALDLLVVIAGSLLPDIDGNGTITKPGSVFRNLIGRTLADLIDFVAGIICLCVRLVFKHRGLLHSPLMPFGLFTVAELVGSTALGWIALGYLIHLAGDFLTVKGIPLLSPFSKRKVSLNLFRTGAIMEFAFSSAFLIYALVYGWELLPDSVKSAHLAFASRFQ
ncbi:MAG: metal-dependent hydrolase [Planctomycetota bacterium]